MLDLGSGMLKALWFPPSVCHKLELERQQHNQLKHTWQRANDQFLESQRLLMRDMQRIESVLSSEQLRQVEVIKKRDQVGRVHTQCTHACPCMSSPHSTVTGPDATIQLVRLHSCTGCCCNADTFRVL